MYGLVDGGQALVIVLIFVINGSANPFFCFGFMHPSLRALDLDLRAPGSGDLSP